MKKIKLLINQIRWWLVKTLIRHRVHVSMETLHSKFTSLNHVPVTLARITIEEFNAINAEFLRLQSKLPTIKKPAD